MKSTAKPQQKQHLVIECIYLELCFLAHQNDKPGPNDLKKKELKSGSTDLF